MHCSFQQLVFWVEGGCNLYKSSYGSQQKLLLPYFWHIMHPWEETYQPLLTGALQRLYSSEHGWSGVVRIRLILPQAGGWTIYDLWRSFLAHLIYDSYELSAPGCNFPLARIILGFSQVETSGCLT